MFERQADLEPQLDGLAARNQGCNGDNAAVARRQAWSCPHVTKQATTAVLLEGWRHRCDLAHRQRIFKSYFSRHRCPPTLSPRSRTDARAGAVWARIVICHTTWLHLWRQQEIRRSDRRHHDEG